MRSSEESGPPDVTATIPCHLALMLAAEEARGQYRSSGRGASPADAAPCGWLVVGELCNPGAHNTASQGVCGGRKRISQAQMNAATE